MIIIVGGGAHIYFISKALISRGMEVTIINKDKQECIRLSRKLQATVVNGNGSEPRILEDAGIRRADRVMAITPQDEDNFVICRLAQEMYGVRDVFALVNDPENETIFRDIGIPATFSLTPVLSNLLQYHAHNGYLTNYVPLAGGKINITEAVVAPDSPCCGRMLKDLDLPENSLIISVHRLEKVFIPSGTTTLLQEDRISFVSLPSNYAQVLKTLVGKD